MKNLFKLLPFMLAVALMACEPEETVDEPTDREIMIEQLSAVAWGNATVTHADDGNLSDMYAEFVIQLSAVESDEFDGNYVVNAGSYAFPQSAGKWSINEELTQITLSNGQVIDFEMTETMLSLDFTVASPSGRMAGVEGHFTFELSAL